MKLAGKDLQIPAGSCLGHCSINGEYVLVMRSCTIGVPQDLPEDLKKHATRIQILSGSQILRSIYIGFIS